MLGAKFIHLPKELREFNAARLCKGHKPRHRFLVFGDAGDEARVASDARFGFYVVPVIMMCRVTKTAAVNYRPAWPNRCLAKMGTCLNTSPRATGRRPVSLCNEH